MPPDQFGEEFAVQVGQRRPDRVRPPHDQVRAPAWHIAQAGGDAGMAAVRSVMLLWPFKRAKRTTDTRASLATSLIVTATQHLSWRADKY
jgi:hypothetical protein